MARRLLLKGPPGSTACFAVGGIAWLVIVPRGRGTIVAVGGPGVFVNDRLGRAENPDAALNAFDLFLGGLQRGARLFSLLAGQRRERFPAWRGL